MLALPLAVASEVEITDRGREVGLLLYFMVGPLLPHILDEERGARIYIYSSEGLPFYFVSLSFIFTLLLHSSQELIIRGLNPIKTQRYQSLYPRYLVGCSERYMRDRLRERGAARGCVDQEASIANKDRPCFFNQSHVHTFRSFPP